MHDLLCRCSSILTCPLLPNPSGPSTGCDSCTATVGASVSVTFVVSFLGVLVASVICYISRRCKKSYKPSSHAEPTGIYYDEVGSNKRNEGRCHRDGYKHCIWFTYYGDEYKHCICLTYYGEGYKQRCKWFTI